MDVLPRERGSGDAWVTDSGARSLLSRLPKRFLPCPGRQLLPGSAAHCCCPQRGDVPSRAQGEAKAKSKQRGGEREAEKARKNERARLNLAPPMGSVAAQRQVTISKLGL